MGRKPNDVSGVYEKNPGSGIWYVRYRTGGKAVKKKIGSRGKAIEFQKKVEYIKSTGDGKLGRSARESTLSADELKGVHRNKQEGATVGELCDAYLSWITDPFNRRRPSDLVNPPQRLKVLKEGLGERVADFLLPYEIEDWLMTLGKKPATLNRYKSTLSSAYRYAKERGKVQNNPVRDVPRFEVEDSHPRWLQDDEEERLRTVLDSWINQTPEHHQLKRLYLRCHPIELTLALGTGLRKGNLYALRWDEHVDLDARLFRFPASMMKARKVFTLPMIDDVHSALLELRGIQGDIEALQRGNQVQGKKPERMVAGGRIFHINENREWWSEALKQAKIENFRFHDLRHSFATRLVKAGVNLKVVQEACAHSSISMTVRYAHVDDQLLRDSLAVLNRPARAAKA